MGSVSPVSGQLKIVIGQVGLAYRVSGDPDAPPMLLLHALGDQGETWEPVAAEMAGAFRMYMPDLRGHGRSDWPGSYSLELMRDDILGFLDALRIGRISVVGHSMGGTVAYLLAEAQPERIENLILEDTPPPFPRDRAIPERPPGPLPFDWQVVPTISRQLNDPEPAWWARLSQITAPPPFPRDRAIPERPPGPLPFDWQVVPTISRQLNDPDPAWWERLSEITARTLVVGGGPTSQ